VDLLGYFGGGLDWYEYCGQNPVKFTDPDGRSPDNITNPIQLGIENIKALAGMEAAHDSDAYLFYTGYQSAEQYAKNTAFNDGLYAAEVIANQYNFLIRTPGNFGRGKTRYSKFGWCCRRAPYACN
jgi:hypothetical protein